MSHSYAGRPGAAKVCALCERAVGKLTRHHLIPRKQHRRRRTQRRFSRAEMRSRILWLCRSCHDHIHAVLAEQELAERFYSREGLLSHPDVARFVTWIRTKPAGFTALSKTRRRPG